MRSLVASITEAFVFFLAIGLVFLGSNFFDYNIPYSDYEGTNPNTVITVASALGLVEDGEIYIEDDNSDRNSVSRRIIDFMNREVSLFKAKVLGLYFPIAIVAGILCLLLGIGWPMAKFRRFSAWEFFDELLVDKRRVWVDQDGKSLGYVGETRSFLLTMFVWLFMFAVTVYWGCILPFLIPLNFIIGVIRVAFDLICTAFFGNASNKKHSTSLKNKSGKENYGICVEHGCFVVAGYNHPNRKLYFNKYYNAVTVQRILTRDEEGQKFSTQDASDTIQYGDEDKHMKYEKKQLVQLFGIICSKKKRTAAASIQSDINKRNYTCATLERQMDYGERETQGYIIKYNRGDSYMLFRKIHNINFTMTIMNYDSRDKLFDVNEWNQWVTTEPDKRPSHLSGKYIDVPSDEDWEW